MIRNLDFRETIEIKLHKVAGRNIVYATLKKEINIESIDIGGVCNAE